MDNLYKGVVLFTVIYFLVYILAFGMRWLFAYPVQGGHFAIAQATSQGSAASFTLLVIEIVIFSAFVIAQMRYKILNRLFMWFKKIFGFRRNSIILTIFILGVVGACGFILSLSSIWQIWIIVEGALLCIFWFILRKFRIRQSMMPSFVLFFLFFVFWEVVLLAAVIIGSSILWAAVIFLYLPIAYASSVLITSRMTALKMNAIAFFSALLFPLFMGSMFTPFWALMLLAAFAVYDLLAVFKTKHMQFLAQKMIALDIPEMFILGDLELAKARIAAAKKGKEVKLKQKDRPLILGGGDAILPSILIVALIYAQLPFLGLLAVFGGIIGIAMNIAVLRRYEKAIPALPLLLVGMASMLVLGLVI